MALRDFVRRSLTGEPTLERTGSDLFDTQVSDFWANLQMTSGFSSPALLERVWVANRCLHMNSNAISTMPLRHYGSRQPAWVANPDPVWFPNGITDAVYSIVSSLYGWGDAFVYITARYADGYPSAWTVLDPSPMTVNVERGRRAYKSGQTSLRADDMVQISRNPGAVRGSSAIKAYSAYTNGLLASADLGRVIMASGTPSAVIKSQRKIDKAQATAIQDSWVTATSARRGAPAVLGPDLDFEKLAFSAEDLQLLSMQKFDAQVIATAFGVPSSLVNMPIEGGLNYQTPILLLEQWWRTELRTTATHISGALSSMMLPAGSYVEFDPYRFLAPTWKELVEGAVALITAGLFSVEEARAIVLGLPPEAPLDAIADLLSPPSAGASPAQGNGNVAQLRPMSTANQY
jgi:HK97 family phage portal protein